MDSVRVYVPLFILLALLACPAEKALIQEVAAKNEAASEGAPLPTSKEDWPWWRGPNSDNTSAGGQVPTVWSETENVLWKVNVPGHGHGSPTLLGNQIFLATADEETEVQLLISYERESGKKLWEKEIHRGQLEQRHKKNSHASSTPASDGEKVFVAFLNNDAIWVTAVNLQGEIVWQQNAGAFDSEHGYAASPVLYKSLVIVSGDNPGGGYMTAMDRQTGNIVWHTRRPASPSYGTPVLAHVAGRAQLLHSGCKMTSSYDPATGELLWSLEGPAQLMANTMAFGGNFVFSSGGYPEKELLCIRADGSGDIVWRTGRDVTYVPSPLFHQGRLYVVNDGGIATLFNAHSGDVIWRERLGGAFSASPTLVGDLLYVPDEEGTTFVLKASDHFEVVARNKLGDGGFASPVICGGRLYLRTLHHLYAIGNHAS
ncbi:MAG: serine/threonine protein kinase [Planctomycetaceae bacterium]|nr:serine/threonine protein kinase [Planctomycetaceae bacterium]